MNELFSLIGRWIGNGKGCFPTIDSFEFREELKFERRGEEELIHYEQKAFLLDDTPSHWESGFIKTNNDGQIEISNSQNSGRVEILTEHRFEKYPSGFRLELKSKIIQNDPRLVRTSRTFEMDESRLKYSIYMETDKASSDSPHIVSELARC